MFAIGGSITRLAGTLSAPRKGAVAAGAALALGLLAAGLVTAGSAHAAPAARSTQAAPAAPSTQAASAACTEPVHVTFTGHSVSNGSVTIRYTIAGCRGTATIRIHQNLLASRHAGSDNVHQANFEVQVSENSPTMQTVPLLAGVAGKCFVQVDFSSATERHGFFTAAASCPAVAPSTPPPSTAPPSTAPPSTAPSSAEILPVSTSVPILPAAAPTDLKPVRSDSGRIAILVGGVIAALALALGLRRARGRR